TGPPEMSSSRMPAVPAGQDVLRGSSRGRVHPFWPVAVREFQALNHSDLVHFDTVNQVQTSGPGIFDEDLMLHSAGAAAAGVTLSG
ncbi:MAG: hypothetical protein WCK53_14760, partial [Methanomicrobiales archaeon]